MGVSNNKKRGAFAPLAIRDNSMNIDFAAFQQAYISFTQGMQLMRLGHYSDAITHFDETIDIAPSVPAYQCRSLCKVMIHGKMPSEIKVVLKEEILNDLKDAIDLASQFL